MNKYQICSVAVLPLLLGGVACTQSTDVAVGTLELRANGEDFIRQGFTSKDGWQIEFDHVYTNIQDLIFAFLKLRPSAQNPPADL